MIRALPFALTLSFAFAFAASASPTVAVMPFRDLSGGGRGAIGEAIRETVTTDLKDVPGLRVIERANIDKVIAEQKLQEQRNDLSPIAAVRVGTLLGATLMVTGAYQRADANVRLTARFVKVETGEVLGSAKVDGRQSEFLRLQDQITAALLKSAGMGEHGRKFVERKRPPLKSLRPVELYGEAVVESDDGKKRAILQRAVAEDAAFTYAARDLDELERRLSRYDAASERSSRDEVAQLKREIAGEHDVGRLMEAYEALFDQLRAKHRWRRLRVEARAAIEHPPQPVPRKLAESALAAAIDADRHLWDNAALLADGEQFVKRFPTSRDYKAVREILDEAIERGRKCEAGEKERAAAVAKAGRDVCEVGEAEYHACRFRDALRAFTACINAHPDENPNDALKFRFRWYGIVWSSIKLGQFADAEKWLQKMEKLEGAHPAYRPIRSDLEDAEAFPFPVDD